jgi:uncharacterized protein (UPF0332 family)
MTAPRQEVAELWQRAQDALRAANTLLTAGFPDFAASRAYYAAFYAASALLLAAGRTFTKHRGVLTAIHRDYVRTGHLPVEAGRIISSLFDLRALGDYGGASHVSDAEARIAIAEAQQFLMAVQPLLPSATTGGQP